jgi:hypothetical protein
MKLKKEGDFWRLYHGDRRMPRDFGVEVRFDTVVFYWRYKFGTEQSLKSAPKSRIEYGRITRIAFNLDDQPIEIDFEKITKKEAEGVKAVGYIRVQ